MNDDFTFLIFTYHNVFHSLLASFRQRKWRLLALLSFTSAFPTQRRWVMMKTNFQPKIGLKQPNVLTQRSQPSIWVEKITQRFLECNEESMYILYINCVGGFFPQRHYTLKEMDKYIILLKNIKTLLKVHTE